MDTPVHLRHLNTLILAPTRELAIQIDQQIEGLGYFTGVSSWPFMAVAMGQHGASSAKPWPKVAMSSLLHWAAHCFITNG
ncbi:MAG: hypothetical protein R2822_25685 [Spirosomataceae bacterium]